MRFKVNRHVTDTAVQEGLLESAK